MISCQNNTSKQPNPVSFIDIHDFFEKEVSVLTQENIGLIQRTNMDSVSRQDTLTEVDWNKQLYAFLDVDIRSTIWTTDFQPVDTKDDPNQEGYVFESTNPKQKVKSFTIHQNEAGEIHRFAARILDESKLSTTETLLSYTQKVGYTMTVKRDTKILGTENYQIVGQFIKTNNN